MRIEITTKSKKTVTVKKEKTDPICLRASIGGDSVKGYYCVVRGDDLDAIEEMLTETLEAFKTAKIKLK